MRRAVAAVTLVLLLGGNSFGGEWPSWFGSTPSHRSKHWAQPGMGCCDDNPLCPELAWWLFEPSHCKQQQCAHGCSHGASAGPRVPIFYPPLPYSPLAAGAQPYRAAPAASAFPH